MIQNPDALACREVGQWSVCSTQSYVNPFVDVRVDAAFRGPSGQEPVVPAFYDGEGTWRVRFSPGEPGRWSYRVRAVPADPQLSTEGVFEATRREGRGFLCARPGESWGFHFESGEPVLVFGDTTYNLFGWQHCGADVEGFVRRRREQGVNLLRARVPVSPFHQPEGYSEWQTRRTWLWGGSEQMPQFDRFNLDYFASVDRVVEACESLDMGLDVILEAWGNEFPWNRRDLFIPEWEELYLRYVLARYDAFRCVWFWTLMNEYEYYPNGNWHHEGPACDLWAARLGRYVKRTAPHGHVVSVHNGPVEPPFARRFARDPGAVDHVMFQHWGTRDERQGWLAAGIEDAIGRALADWPGTAVFSEWGYERNPELPEKFPLHRWCDVDHCRRGGWRGLFCGLGVISGWEHTWGPWMIVDRDQQGMAQFLLMRRFFTEVVPFHRVRPAPELVRPRDWEHGCRPLALADPGRDVIAVYLPVGGTVALDLPEGKRHTARWFDPRTGELQDADPGETAVVFTAATAGSAERPWDWVLVLRSR